MKIGLLTFHRAINYGAVLQCYGLSESLRAMGHDVEIIDYRPVYIERYRQLFQTFNLRQLGGFKRIMEFFKVLIGINVRRDANCRFDAFLSNNFHFSHIVHYPQEIPQSYDVIIIGSDQVWCPKICFGFDKIYWGQFPHDRIKLLTYAASIGEVDQLSDLDWEQIKKRINVFDGISVRESQLKEALYIKLGLDVRCNIDPSLLLSKNYYESIVEMPNIEGDYILAFSVVNVGEVKMNWKDSISIMIQTLIFIYSSVFLILEVIKDSPDIGKLILYAWLALTMQQNIYYKFLQMEKED